MILEELDVIARSGFGETPNESFHTMQDGWRKEINEVLFELRKKEKVTNIDNPSKISVIKSKNTS